MNEPRRESGAAGVDDLNLSSLLHILVHSGYVGTKDLGRLSATNSAVNRVVNDGNIWASVYKQMYQNYEMTHVIPKEVIDKRGYRWLVRKFLKNAVSEAPPVPLLPAPTHTEDDLVLFGELSYNPDKNNSAAHKVERRFSITGETLRPLLTDGMLDTTFSKPIVVGDAEIRRLNSIQLMQYPDRVLVRPAACHLKSIELRVRLLRLRDMKSCCVYEPNNTERNFDAYPMLKPLDRAMDLTDFRNLTIEKLDFQTDIIPGCINLFDGAAYHSPERDFETKGLPLQESATANSITIRFPYLFSIIASATVSVSLDKKILITGCSLEARKTPLDDDWWSMPFYEESVGIESKTFPNNGVTVGHILSEMYCPDDSDE